MTHTNTVKRYVISVAPSWANWIARDESGQWVYFASKPTAGNSRGRYEGKWYQESGTQFKESCNWDCDDQRDWTKSLVNIKRI